MKYKKRPLDRFLEQRINDNAKELKQTFNETLRMEQNCLEQIRHSINHCKNNIAVCEKQIKKCSSASLAILETKKSAFKDNLLIWNKMLLNQYIQRYMKLRKSWLTLPPIFSNLSSIIFRIMTIEHLLMYEKNFADLESRILLN